MENENDLKKWKMKNKSGFLKLIKDPPPPPFKFSRYFDEDWKVIEISLKRHGFVLVELLIVQLSSWLGLRSFGVQLRFQELECEGMNSLVLGDNQIPFLVP